MSQIQTEKPENEKLLHENITKGTKARSQILEDYSAKFDQVMDNLQQQIAMSLDGRTEHNN
jgi:hypothetical protein